MPVYIRADRKEDYDWLNKLIDSLAARDMNDRFLQINYPYLTAWREYLDAAISTKSDVIPKQMVVEEDQAALVPPPPKKRGRPAGAKSKNPKTRKSSQPAVIVNDIFMCPDHPKRFGKQAPRDNCERCWDIYKQLKGAAAYELARRKHKAKEMRA